MGKQMNMVCCFVAAAFFSAVLIMVGRSASVQKSCKIMITAQDAGQKVTFRGASVDGRWYNPSEIVVDRAGWIYDKGEEAYTSVGCQMLEINLPPGDSRTLTFNAGPEEGMALVQAGGDTIAYDCWKEKRIALGLPYSLPACGAKIGQEKEIFYFGAALFLLFSVCLLLVRGTGQEEQKERDVWMDVLRSGCCFVVVLLHCTCNAFDGFQEITAVWYPHLVVNSFTAFAVPCFYMISGACLLKKEHSIQDVLCKRVPKLLLPLLAWSVVYILASNDWRARRLIDMCLKEQTDHLWFMYSILGLYFLLPFTSKLYRGGGI